MGRMKEQLDDVYKKPNYFESVDGSEQLVHPTFIGLIDLVKQFTAAQNLSELNMEWHEVLKDEIEMENADPNQLHLFSAEAI